MKEFIIVIWVSAVLWIACSLSSWEGSVSIFLVTVSALWHGIFLVILAYVRNKNKGCSKDISMGLYALSAIPAIFNPLISMIIFFGVSIYRVCKISNVTVLNDAFKEQFVLSGSEVRVNDDCRDEVDINPATGLEMYGATDIAGNLYGSSDHP